MSDRAGSEPAFESSVLRAYAPGSSNALTLSDESALAKTIVRAEAGSPASASLAVSFGSSRREGATLVLGQRPDEYMLIGSAQSNASIVARLDTSGHVSVIDHTHSRALFRLTGAQASATLEKVCSLDWSNAMTPDGAVVSASIAKVNCDIARNDREPVDAEPASASPSYLIACDRSFGQYLFDALIDAGGEFGIGVVTAADGLQE